MCHQSVEENIFKKRYNTPTGSILFNSCKHNTKQISCSKLRPGDLINTLYRCFDNKEHMKPSNQNQTCI